jgi:hypothetical protein
MVLPVINIGSKLDGKGFKQAETATDKLGKQAKKLAGALGLAFGTAQVIAYGKNAVKAFAENEKSAKRLETVLKNLGLAFDNQAIEKNLGDISAKFGYEGEVLREAFQKLVTVTGSTTKSQDLLNLSLDVAAGSGEDLLTVNQDLAAVYVGNTKGLRKYNLGLTQSELKTLSFNDAVALLTKNFKGSGTAELETYAGQMRVLGEAADNAQEIIGKGLVDSFVLLAGDNGIAGATSAMEKFATKTSNALYGVSVLIDKINSKFGKFGGRSLGDILYAAAGGGFIDAAAKIGNDALIAPKPFSTPMSISGSTDSQAKIDAARKKADEEAKKRAAAIAKSLRDQAKSQAKILKDKKLALAIDKAQLALGKGENIFDLDAIQLNAALINQAQQLGNVTNAAQVLQIANDSARLRVKQSIAALEDAIAAKDEAAIIKATAKLNEDLKILNALSGQNTQLKSIETILKGLNPKDLINIQNLKDALDLLEKINLAQTGSKSAPTTLGKPSTSPSGLTPATTIAETNANVASLGGVITQILPNLKEFTPDTGIISGRNPNGSEYNFSVTVNTGVGDPNAIAESINQVIQDAVDRGSLRGVFAI